MVPSVSEPSERVSGKLFITLIRFLKFLDRILENIEIFAIPGPVVDKLRQLFRTVDQMFLHIIRINRDNRKNGACQVIRKALR